MSKVFDPIRARSSVDALAMICVQHPEAAINAAALHEELEAADEQINQLARALREAVEPPTLMGEPVSAEPIAYASSKPERINQLLSARQYRSCLPKNRADFDIPLYASGARPDAASLKRAYEAGWVQCAIWGERDDLITDCDSAAYTRERDSALAKLTARSGQEKQE